MHFSEYIEYDAVGLAHLIKSGQVSAQEVQQLARQAILAVNPTLNALVGELFEESLPSSTTGPFAGVPFVIKDLSLHAAGVKTGMGTRLTGEGIVFPHDTDLMTRFKQAGDLRPWWQPGRSRWHMGPMEPARFVFLLPGVDWLGSSRHGDVPHLDRIPMNASQVLALILRWLGRCEIPQPCLMV